MTYHDDSSTRRRRFEMTFWDLFASSTDPIQRAMIPGGGVREGPETDS